MMSVELTHEYKMKLKRIVEKFQGNLRRGFNNEGIRLEKSPKNQILQDVAFSSETSYLLFKNMTLLSNPEFRLRRYEIDLANARLQVSLDLGQLTFRGELCTVAETMFPNLITSSHIAIKLHMHQTSAAGWIGLHVNDDSFTARNYSIKYEFASGQIEELKCEHECLGTSTFQFDEVSPFRLFFDELTEKLNVLLDEQLNKSLKEYLLHEVIEHEKENELCDYKDYLHKRELNANYIIDNLLNKAKTYHSLNNIIIDSKFRLPYKKHNEHYNTLTGHGYITDINTITRPSDWNLYENDSERIAYGYLMIKDFKFLCNYHTLYMGRELKGHISGTIYQNKFAVCIKIDKQQRNTLKNIEIHVHLAELSDIAFDITGLGALSWMYDTIKSLIIGHLRIETRRVLKTIEKALFDAHRLII